MYLYLNGKISLEQLDDEFVLDSSVKNTLLVTKFIVDVNNLQALVASGEIKNLDDETFNKLIEDEKQFRATVDQKETDAKEAIEDKQKQDAWHKSVNDAHSQAVLQGLGLVDGAEKPEMPGEKPQPRKPVKPKTDLSQFEQEEQAEPAKPEEQAEPAKLEEQTEQPEQEEQTEQTEQAEQTTGGVTNNAAENNEEKENKKPKKFNRRLVMTITTKKRSLLSRLKNMFANNEESSKILLTTPYKTKVKIFEYGDHAPIKLDDEDIADESAFNEYLETLPEGQRTEVKRTVHQYLKNRKLTLTDNKNGDTAASEETEEEDLNK